MSKHEKLIGDEIVKRLGDKLLVTSKVTTHQTESKQTKRGVIKYRTDADLPGNIILSSDCIIPYRIQEEIKQAVRLVVGGQSKRVIYTWLDASDSRKLGSKKSRYGRGVYCASAKVVRG